MSEEMAFALANFCRASLDSDTGDEASAFLLLGSLEGKKKKNGRARSHTRVRRKSRPLYFCDR